MKAKLRARAHNFFKYKVYIKTVEQGFQLLLLASASELYYFDCSSATRCVSLVFAAVLGLFCVGFVLLGVCLSCKAPDYEQAPDANNTGLFCELKTSVRARLHPTMVLVRKSLLIVVVIFLQSLALSAVLGLISSIQLCHIVYIAAVRPFKQTKDNMAEICNETFFSGFLL